MDACIVIYICLLTIANKAAVVTKTLVKSICLGVRWSSTKADGLE